ncbi:hypothetical protein D3C74_18120 [compost metagenome]
METKQKQMKGTESFMSILAWVAGIIGIILIVVNVGFFSDRNLGLMIGIGCVVGGIFIYMISKSLGTARMKEEQEEGKR